MAGTIHSLVLSPRHAKTSPFCFPTPRFLASSSLLVSRSVSFNCNRLISRPTRACQQPDKVGGNGGQADITSGPAKGLTKQFLDFASNNFLPFALVSGVAIGFANPSLGCLADRYSLSKFSTVGIFIISGLTLRSEAIGAAVEAWSVGMFGLCSILLFTPYFSRLILQVQLQPQEFVTGLAIFSCMPTTLSSGIALTQLAGGNSALALAMTVISNLLGILIVPFSIAKFIADGVGVSVPTKQLFRSLILTLLIPLVVGKVLRESSKGLADFVDKNSKLFSKISALFLSLVPWIQVSRSRSLLLMVEPKIFLVAIGMGIMLHLFLLAFNSLAIRALSALSGGSKSVFAKEENFSALLLVASQKTLPVMVAVVEQLGGALGESGLLVLPCVAAHILQIVMDSFLVNIFLRKDRSSTKAKLA
ncbi:probable sodium/metabolite cotransporter BASS4, chloroplastic [Carica papaya]|uniref:probable sodium/metabolite cotransporter BASS4, chloroplastic n=1 Tax=Carica papaya TaxID=3649 RepID=UPI000B8CFCA0|nr:probable sodium/metabolite cotransporter BASS4, chloroplastic [Carica papaya]XP_021887863.1 probable sodium/metabolite cotransporter BASS4, chloroplastic [Carica papaya]